MKVRTVTRIVTCKKCGTTARVFWPEGKNEPLPKGWSLDRTDRLFKYPVCGKCSSYMGARS